MFLFKVTISNQRISQMSLHTLIMSGDGIGMNVECYRGFLDLEVGDVGTVIKVDGYPEGSVKVVNISVP